MAKKRPAKKKAAAKRPAQRKHDAWEEYRDHLARWKYTATSRVGIVSAMDSSPALRILVENWAGLPHEVTPEQLPRRGTSFNRIWSVHRVDLVAAAEQIGLAAHVVLRVIERARKLGVVFPDGTLHPAAERYLGERDQYAVIKPPREQ